MVALGRELPKPQATDPSQHRAQVRQGRAQRARRAWPWCAEHGARLGRPQRALFSTCTCDFCNWPL